MPMNARIYQARTDTEKAARRSQILSAAESLWIERGLKGATVGEVAERAGLGKGTIYLYYDGLEDLKRSVLEKLGRDLQTLTIPRASWSRVAGLVFELTSDLDRKRFIAALTVDENSVYLAFSMAGKE